MNDRGKRRGDPESAQCPHGENGDHEWGPDPDDPDAGDTCTLCGVGR